MSEDGEDGEWSGLFKGSLAAKGMSLGFVAPKICEGKPVVQLQQAKGTETWSAALIFYVMGY